MNVFVLCSSLPSSYQRRPSSPPPRTWAIANTTPRSRRLTRDARERRVDRDLVGAVAVEQHRARAVGRAGRAGTRSRSAPGCRRARSPTRAGSRTARGRSPSTGWRFTSVDGARRRVVVVGRGRRSPATCTGSGRSSASYSGLPPSHAEYTGSGIASTWSSATAPSSPSVEDAEPFDGVGALGHHEEAGERVDVVEAGVVAVREDGRPGARPGVRDRRDREREVLGAVGVGEHEEAVAGRARRGARRGTRGPARAARRRTGCGVGSSASTSHTSLVTFDADGDHDEAAAARATDADVEAVVVLLEHEHVVVGRRCRAVAPHLPRAHGVVGTRVEDGARRRSPTRRRSRRRARRRRGRCRSSRSRKRSS